MPEKIQFSHTSTRFDRVDWLSFGITALISLAVYLVTLAPEVTLENSGMFTTGAVYPGVQNPPGCPLWTIYSWVFIKLLPFSNPAWRLSVGSAVAAAVAGGTVALTVSFGGRVLIEATQEGKWIRLTCGYVAGMTLGLSSAVWPKAVIVDTWTLSLLLFTVILCLALRWIMEPEGRWRLATAFLLLGLLLTSSQELIVILPVLAAAAMLGNRDLGRDLAVTILPLGAIFTAWNRFGVWIVFPDRLNKPLLITFATALAAGLVVAVRTRRLASVWKFAFVCNFWFFLGISFSLLLPLFSMTNPPANWGYARTIEGFYHVVSRGQYDLVNPSDNLEKYANQLAQFALMCGNGFGWLHIFFSAVAICLIRRLNPAGRKWVFALLMMLIVTGLVLLAELNPTRDRNMQDLVLFYFMPLFAALAVLGGLGAMLGIGLGVRLMEGTPRLI